MAEVMSIEDQIRAVQAEVRRNPDRGDELREQAIAAIYGGLGSVAWNDYMRNFNFAGTPAQLARLTTRDEDHCHPYIAQARAYLVANPTCLPGTDLRMLDGITGFLDAPCEEEKE
ncbi:MAG TPA: hypothetical protein VJT82_00895 [Pyrinomonadaceae bacterium]|nr:hypothetical protein [Pyrinomonadaceae bacterium]